jgi:hypothetical protein
LEGAVLIPDFSKPNCEYNGDQARFFKVVRKMRPIGLTDRPPNFTTADVESNELIYSALEGWNKCWRERLVTTGNDRNKGAG